MGSDDPVTGIGGEKTKLVRARLHRFCLLRSIRAANATVLYPIRVSPWFNKFLLYKKMHF